jgi:hypothetical protein
MKIYAIDDLYKGRGPDKQPRKRRHPQGTSAIGKMAFWGKTSSKEFKSPSGARKFIENRTYLKYPEMKKSDLGLTPQDEKNIDSIRELVSKRPDLQKALEGPVKWIGKAGFDECVAHLSGKKGITNAKALCGYLKEEARNRGTLKPSHMGRIEKKEYLKNRKKGKK